MAERAALMYALGVQRGASHHVITYGFIFAAPGSSKIPEKDCTRSVWPLQSQQCPLHFLPKMKMYAEQSYPRCVYLYRSELTHIDYLGRSSSVFNSDPTRKCWRSNSMRSMNESMQFIRKLRCDLENWYALKMTNEWRFVKDYYQKPCPLTNISMISDRSKLDAPMRNFFSPGPQRVSYTQRLLGIDLQPAVKRQSSTTLYSV